MVETVEVAVADLKIICEDILEEWCLFDSGAFGSNCHYCQYCGAEGKRYWAKAEAEKNIKHKQNCAKLVAQDLMTRL